MAKRDYLIFVVALLVWVGVFYFIDMSIMEVQGLPVGPDLMPK